MKPYLIKMCNMPQLRINPPNEEIQRHKWRPMEVIEDATRSRYTDAGAWGFIAECLLNGGVAVEYKPPCAEFDDHAYVMKHADGRGARRIYMKVAIRPPVRLLMGISFHFEQPR